MNVQHHVIELKRQLDNLYQAVEELQQNVPEGVDFAPQEMASFLPQLSNETLGLEQNVGNNSLHHKDILFDETALLEGHPLSNNVITPEIQIKRLTAQLTVAYKRIAQLEEQLISRQAANKGAEYIYS